MTTFKIVKETKKAKLIADQAGVQFWVQNRMLRTDGSLTPSGEANYKEAQEKAELAASGKEQYVFAGWVIQQTEKAYKVKGGLEVNLDRAGDQVREFFGFVPKSQTTTVDGEVDGKKVVLVYVKKWMAEQKHLRAEDTFAAGAVWA